MTMRDGERRVGAAATLRTGEVARRAGVNVETLRFYEREGILPSPPRRESGYRSYPPETVEVVRFIKCAQKLGLSLRDVQELLGLRRRPRVSAARVRRLLEPKLSEIDRQVRELEALRGTIAGLLGRCDGRGTVASCPILKHLSEEAVCGD